MRVRLTLYVTGQSHRSERAVRNLNRVIARMDMDVELEVVDLAADPARGDQDRILATPTLVLREPGVERRVIGDLSTGSAVAALLEQSRKFA